MTRINPCRCGRRKFRRTGAPKSAFFPFLPFATGWSRGALKLILEPIFEADFQSGSYGYRPKRTAQEAVLQVDKAIMEGKTRVIDLDLRAYLDSYTQCSYG